jgi:flagellin-specific chaperone FliS
MCEQLVCVKWWWAVSSEEKKGEARVDIKKLDEIISKLDDIVKRLEKLNISEEKKKELIVTLEDTINELEDAITSLERRCDVEELKEVGILLRTLGDVARDVLGSAINKFIEIIDGKRLGENIAALYNSLKGAGLPDQVVQDIVKEYTTRVLSSIPNIADLASKFLSVAEVRGNKAEKEAEREKSQ